MTHPLIAAIVLAHGAVCFAQTPGETCCELKVTSTPGSATELTTTITNLNQPVVTVQITSGENDFKVRVTSEEGREANRTDYGRRLLAGEYMGRFTFEDLNKSETFTQKLDLGAIFKLSSGTYKVSLTREVIVEKKKAQLQATTQIRIP